MKGKNKGKGCCKVNKVVILLSALIMFIALALGANATIDCNLTVSSNSLLNATFNVSADGSTGNVTVFYEGRASDTANSSYSFLANQSNTSGLRHHVFNLGTTATDSVVAEESSVWQFRATCRLNASGNIDIAGESSATSTETGATNTLDRGGIPTTPTSPSPSGTLTSRDQTISATVGGANTTSCTLRFIEKNPGSSAYAMTHTGNECSQAFTNLPTGTFVYTIEATDGLNISVPTAQQTMQIDIRTTASKKAYIISGGKLPSQASTTAQQRAGGQQAESTLDRVIASAPEQAQEGLTKAKESVTKQYKGFEAVKTWTGTGVGCAAGLMGLVIPPLGLITIPAGCLGGHVIGMIV